MIFCEYCQRRFFDGETIAIKLVNHTEHPHHCECLEKSRQEEIVLRRIFNDPTPVDYEWFERIYRHSQVGGAGELGTGFRMG